MTIETRLKEGGGIEMSTTVLHYAMLALVRSLSLEYLPAGTAYSLVAIVVVVVLTYLRGRPRFRFKPPMPFTDGSTKSPMEEGTSNG